MRYRVLIAVFAVPLLTGCASLLSALSYNDPLTAEEHNHLGVIYEREGDYDLALREYEAAADKDGNLAVPIVNAGNIYLKKGEYEKALKSYKKALKIDEENIEAANNLASLYLEQGENYEEGLQVLKKAAAGTDHVPPYALDTMGVLYFRLGYGEEALKYLTLACENSSNNETLRAEIDSHIKDIDHNSGCI